MSISILNRVKIGIVRTLLNLRNPYMFESIKKLYKEVADKNRVVIPEQMTSLNDYTIKYDFSKITTALDQLDRFYYNLDKMIQDNPQRNLEDIMNEIEESLHKKSDEEDSSEESISRMNVSYYKGEELKENSLAHRFQELFQKEDVEFQKYSFVNMLVLAFEVVLTYWEYLCYFILMVYHVKINGFITLVIPFAIFGYALTEETRPKFKVWSLLFYFFVIMILLKFLRQYLSLQNLLYTEVIKEIGILWTNINYHSWKKYWRQCWDQEQV